MRFPSIIIQGLLATVCEAREKKFRRQFKFAATTPNAPTDPGITSKCTYYDTWDDKLITCLQWLQDWAITQQQFSEYNPTVGDNCSGIKVGHSYCVEINYGQPEEPDEPEASSTEIPDPEPTDAREPHILTQEGLIGSCVDLHKASEGDKCTEIVSNFGTFDFETFFKWNPAVGKDCSGLWAGYYYCVGVPGTQTSTSTKTTVAATEPTGSKEPTVIQKGLIKGCSLFRQNGKEAACAKIVSDFHPFHF